MARIVVVGGGIGGSAVALFLGRRGHAVTVLEKDRRRAGSDLEADFFDWERPGVPQAVQPHGLLGPVRSVLLAEAPDVYAAMLELGAEERSEFDRFPSPPPALSGDEDLVTIRARRIVLERALSDAVHRQSEVTVRHGMTATGLRVDGPGSTPQVTGVESDGGPLVADLVVDAAGRRSPVPNWLAAHGTRPPVIDNHRTGFAYFCRWYRLRPDAPRHPEIQATGGSTPFAVGGVFPSDNGIFATHLFVSTNDPTRAALRNPDVYEALTREFAECAAWLALPHDPVGPVRVMAGLDNRRTALVDDDGPIATGLLGVGDSVLHTNPTFGFGAAFALRTAAWVASHAHRPADATLTLDNHRWVNDTLGPWFERQVSGDIAGEQRLRTTADTAPEDPETAFRAAVAWCALDDPQVMRARAEVRHLVALPEDAFTPRIRDRVTAWLADHPNFVPPQRGPSRQRWQELVDAFTPPR